MVRGTTPHWRRRCQRRAYRRWRHTLLVTRTIHIIYYDNDYYVPVSVGGAEHGVKGVKAVVGEEGTGTGGDVNSSLDGVIGTGGYGGRVDGGIYG